MKVKKFVFYRLDVDPETYHWNDQWDHQMYLGEINGNNWTLMVTYPENTTPRYFDVDIHKMMADWAVNFENKKIKKSNILKKFKEEDFRKVFKLIFRPMKW